MSCEVNFKHPPFYTRNWSTGKRGQCLKKENGTRWKCGFIQGMKMPEQITTWANTKDFFKHLNLFKR